MLLYPYRKKARRFAIREKGSCGVDDVPRIQMQHPPATVLYAATEP